jgi:(p)ppGpp synthase/HD superfamily hydrolase
MKEWITVLKAADAAARWHVHQRRKGAAKEPYVNHLLEVAMLVADEHAPSERTRCSSIASVVLMDNAERLTLG